MARISTGSRQDLYIGMDRERAHTMRAEEEEGPDRERAHTMRAEEEGPDSAPSYGKLWSVAVLVSCFILQLISNGHDNTYGVLLPSIVERNTSRIYEPSYARASLAGSILQFMFMMGGLAGGVVAKRWGARITCVLGALCATLGLVLSSFVTKIYTFYFTYSIISGFGLSQLYLTSLITLPHYFVKHRALANAFVTSGGGMGTIVYSSMREVLIRTFSWERMMYIEAAVVMVAVPCGLTLRPPPSAEEDDTSSSDVPQLTSTDNNKKEDSETDRLINKKPKSATLCEIMRQPQFLIFCGVCFLNAFNLQMPLTYLPSHATRLGLDPTHAAHLVTMTGVADVSSRLLFGVLANYLGVRRLYLLTGCILIGAVASCCMPLMSTFPHLVVYSLTLGMFLGGWIALYMVIMVDILGISDIEKACGLAMAFEAFAPLLINPLGGVIIDTTGESCIVFLVGGSFAVVAAILTLPLKLYMKYN